MNKRENKTKYAILGMLSFGPKSGYEIKKGMRNSTAFFWSESDGQIYPILKKLAADNLITCSEQHKAGKHYKKIYTLMEDGVSELKDWLLQEPTTFNIRNEFLLQLFFGHNLSDKNNVDKIKEYHHALTKHLALFSTIEQRIKEKSQHPKYLLLSLSYGQHSLLAEIAWCKEAIALLTQEA